MHMLTGLPTVVSVPMIGLVVLVATIYTTYATFARWLKWLTAVLFAYVVTAFMATPDWRQVLAATFVPRLASDSLYMTTAVAVLGTTISPSLFFWQASHEVEAEKALGRRAVAQRRGATAHELADARLDVATGMFFSNLVMFFIILATGATLHASGQTQIETAGQAAEALRPLAGDGAYLLFAVGLIGTGLLAVPVLAGAAPVPGAPGSWLASGLSLRPPR